MEAIDQSANLLADLFDSETGLIPLMLRCAKEWMASKDIEVQKQGMLESHRLLEKAASMRLDLLNHGQRTQLEQMKLLSSAHQNNQNLLDGPLGDAVKEMRGGLTQD